MLILDFYECRHILPAPPPIHAQKWKILLPNWICTTESEKKMPD